ncbi:hypothetical protein ACLVWQ_09470 [Streptomyces sp. CWNU-52B]|uniref:hypothetical protein n=1 Tax=unclassified Streptomyces TaxID=2593676 RepID=UPI0039BFE749
MKVDEAAAKGLIKKFTEFVHERGRYKSFKDDYWDFAGAQEEHVLKFLGTPRIREGMEKNYWKPAVEKAGSYRSESQPIKTPSGEPLRLYRKMAAREAAKFLGAKPEAGIKSSMKHNEDPAYHKYFTSSLTHTANFNNANSADQENERILEFTIPADAYWRFFKTYGAPNQKAGVIGDPKSAVVNQEGHRVGAGVNFKTKEQVDEVYQDKTHHNIGIGHGNVADFAKIATGIREVDPSEVESAVKKARAAMVAALTQ